MPDLLDQLPERPTIPEWGDIPEDVREAMVERGRARYEREVGGGHADLVREVLAAALTPPPPRPEGAEAIEHLIGSWDTFSGDFDGFPEGDTDRLADWLAERGVRAPEVGQ